MYHWQRLTAALLVALVGPVRTQAQALTVARDEKRQTLTVLENGVSVLCYNHGAVPVPDGIPARYARGDYIHPLYGLHGEVLTDDYPKDHPHHRGVSWSWPVTRWGNEVRDIWAVAGVWSRPVAVRRAEGGDDRAVLEVENQWRWGDETPLVREEVRIDVYAATPRGRFIDLEVRLTALTDGVAIGGRPKGKYGGFGLRAAPVKDQQIQLAPVTPDPAHSPSWIDYAGLFADSDQPTGVALLEHPANSGYPNERLQYPQLNYVMPAFPGDREVALSQERPLVLRHRLWIHPGRVAPAALNAAWYEYAADSATQPPVNR